MIPSDSPGPARTSTIGAPSPDRKGPGVAGNERLTALAGAVLLALIVAEVATFSNIRALPAFAAWIHW
jgi:hypothetical protein